MPRYYLHLRDGTDELLDEEGREFADMEALRKAVVDGARDIMSNEVRGRGLLDLRYRIDAEDSEGKIVYALPFRHAVNIIPDGGYRPILGAPSNSRRLNLPRHSSESWSRRLQRELETETTKGQSRFPFSAHGVAREPVSKVRFQLSLE